MADGRRYGTCAECNSLLMFVEDLDGRQLAVNAEPRKTGNVAVSDDGTHGFHLRQGQRVEIKCTLHVLHDYTQCKLAVYANRIGG